MGKNHVLLPFFLMWKMSLFFVHFNESQWGPVLVSLDPVTLTSLFVSYNDMWVNFPFFVKYLLIYSQVLYI